VLLTLVQIWALTHGPSANAAFHEWMRYPLMLGVNVIAFLFVLFHAVTWFGLTPKAMVIRVKGQRVPDWAISGSNYAAWVLVSLCVAWIVLRA
jgi:fumarate reductase subunit C